MAKLEPWLAKIHKEIYSQLLDELDNDIVKEIMSNPNCEEALLLNARVESAIKERLSPTTVLT